MKFTFHQLYHVCSSAIYEPSSAYRHKLESYPNYVGHNDDAEPANILSEEDYEWIKQREEDLRIVCCDFSMSENHPGGDDVRRHEQWSAGGPGEVREGYSEVEATRVR